MRPYLITAKLMRPSNMKRFPTPALEPIDNRSPGTYLNTLAASGILTIDQASRDVTMETTPYLKYKKNEFNMSQVKINVLLISQNEYSTRHLEI
jgi:hypothetical protein